MYLLPLETVTANPPGIVNGPTVLALKPVATVTLDTSVLALYIKPFRAVIPVDCSSPVEGLYRYLALLVNMVVGRPVVASANSGNKLLAVVVSLLRVAPADTVPQLVLVPSDVRYLPFADVWDGARALNAVLAVV